MQYHTARSPTLRSSTLCGVRFCATSHCGESNSALCETILDFLDISISRLCAVWYCAESNNFSETILECFSGAQMGWINEKKNAKKSRDTASLSSFPLFSICFLCSSPPPSYLTHPKLGNGYALRLLFFLGSVNLSWVSYPFVYLLSFLVSVILSCVSYPFFCRLSFLLSVFLSFVSYPFLVSVILFLNCLSFSWISYPFPLWVILFMY